jgi:release factor glutamine methyltransferase
MPSARDLADLATTLRAAGCVAAEEEAAELFATTAGDDARLAELVARRVRGEPLAWLTGSVRFCDQTVLVDSGVYVPRWQSEPLARRAAAALAGNGVAVDLCTGAGAIAMVLQAAKPGARVIGTDLDPVALTCAGRNGVEVFEGDLTAAIPFSLRGRVDVLTAVCPYVPTAALALLPRDVLAYEPRLALDGGPAGTALLERTAHESTAYLRNGGRLLLELGGEEAEVLRPILQALGYREITLHTDEDGDVRSIDAIWSVGVG